MFALAGRNNIISLLTGAHIQRIFGAVPGRDR